MANYDFEETPKLVTLRGLEEHSLAIKKAMKHYDCNVSSRIFISAMKDVPKLYEELTNLRANHRKLYSDYQKLKEEVERYFEIQDGLRNMIK